MFDASEEEPDAEQIARMVSRLRQDDRDYPVQIRLPDLMERLFPRTRISQKQVLIASISNMVHRAPLPGQQRQGDPELRFGLALDTDRLIVVTVYPSRRRQPGA